MASDPTFAVIVVAYQRPRELERALAALEVQTIGRAAMEICVVNNGGAEPARAAWADRVDHWIDSPENLGCSGGRNLGAEKTSAPILVFVDDDGITNPAFVESLGDVLDRHETAVAVRGKAVALAHPLLTAMAEHYDRGAQEREDLLTLEGAAAIRRAAWEAAGGYDVDRAYHEGLELSLRLLDTSPDAKMMYTPHAVLAHDFVRGLRHLNDKARMMAKAKRKVVTEEDPRLLAIIERAKAYKQHDGRAPWAKVAGFVMLRIYKTTILAHRARAALKS